MKRIEITATIALMCMMVTACGLGSGRQMTISITDFGAASDGETLCTSSINDAIGKCASKGGGTVTVPAGTFRTGTIVLRDNVTILLEEGSVLVADSDLGSFSHLETSDDKSRYDSGKGTVNDNCADNPVWTQCLILADGVSNAAIKGSGTIDGSNLRNPEGEENMRGPHTILLSDCCNVTIEGIHLINASNYAVLGYDLENCLFEGVSFRGGWDGIHIRGSRNVTISGCSFATGDDAIAGGYWENMLIEGCFIQSACNGIRMIMPCDGLTIDSCRFEGPCPVEHITSKRKNMLHAINLEPAGWGPAPGDVRNVTVSNCTIRNLFSPLCVTLGAENNGENLLIENVTATGIDGFALSVKTWTDSRFRNVTIRNSAFQYKGQDNPDFLHIKELPFDRWPSFPTWGAWFRNVDSLKIENVDFSLDGNDSREAVGSY